jgi:ferredoxin
VRLVHRGTILLRPSHEHLARLSELLAGAPLVPFRRGVRREGVPRRSAGPGTVVLQLVTRVREIRADGVVLETGGRAPELVPADAVFTLIGRESATELLQRSGVGLATGPAALRRIGLALSVLLCAAFLDWKSGGALDALWRGRGWFPYSLPGLLAAVGGTLARAAAEPRTVAGTLALGAARPAFWAAFACSALVVTFGARRIRRRRTPYVTAQTLTLIGVQVVLLFLLPEVLLPWMGRNGWLPHALLDALFPVGSSPQDREYWRAYGLVLAWPLQIGNVLTREPLGAWLAIAALQTMLLLPLGVRRHGKGFYCGWICPRGALAETVGEGLREKMPHGPSWNRLALAGQGLLVVVTGLLALRIIGWLLPAGNAPAALASALARGYGWVVDVVLVGALGYGLFFRSSGRVWCRFLCPLGAFLNLPARLSRFRILADARRCIFCGRCTAVCHQGVDVMGFASRGRAMEDPQCVRCSACVHECPTGVLSFGRVDGHGRPAGVDALPASPILMRERG